MLVRSGNLLRYAVYLDGLIRLGCLPEHVSAGISAEITRPLYAPSFGILRGLLLPVPEEALNLALLDRIASLYLQDALLQERVGTCVENVPALLWYHNFTLPQTFPSGVGHPIRVVLSGAYLLQQAKSLDLHQDSFAVRRLCRPTQ